MELPMSFSWLSHLLLLTLWLHVQVLHVESAKMGLWHMYQNGSRLLPKGCGSVCASQLRMERLSAGALTVKQSESPLSINELGEHYVRVIAGGQLREGNEEVDGGQYLTLLFSTGMDLTIWQTTNCKDYNGCFDPDAPAYDGLLSETVDPVPKNSPFCNSLQGSPYKRETETDRCGFNASYRDGISYSVGEAVTETMYVRDTLTGEYVGFQDVYGLSPKNEIYLDTNVSGVLGALRGGRGFSFLEQEEGKAGKARSRRRFKYSFCLPSQYSEPGAGFLVLKDHTNINAYPTTALSSALFNPAANFVEIAEIWFNGQVATEIPTQALGLAAIDTGTVYSRMIEAAYNPFRDKWRAALSELGLGSPFAINSLLDTCYYYPEKKQLPQVELGFWNGQRLTIPDVGNSLTFTNSTGHQFNCFAYAKKGPPTDQHPENVIVGSMQLQTTRVFFDFPNTRVAWAAGQC